MIGALALLTAAVVGLGTPAASPQSSTASDPPGWQARIERVIGDRPVGIAVFNDGVFLYGHSHKQRRIPASNEKLLMSMALLAESGPKTRLSTELVAPTATVPVIRDDLYLEGSGDPAITGGGAYGKLLPFAPTRIGRLARQVKDMGVEKIQGSIVGATSYFQHDWYAPGWKAEFPSEEVPLPSALTFEGNIAKGHHINDPEFRAARALTKRLESLGIKVTGPPRAEVPPEGAMTVVAEIRSQPLQRLLDVTNKESSNFFAELLGKRLSVETFGAPGTIQGGARAMVQFAGEAGVRLSAFDASGLSYENRVSPKGLAILLGFAADEPWGPALRRSLAKPGEGTLESRLAGVTMRGKTGTLDEISALSGYVWLKRTETWAEFAILSGGLPKYTAMEIEDKIVKILSERAT